MSNPQTRTEFAEYCLRALGAPVLEINVSDEQIDDRIDFALKTWWDYHFDGTEKLYYKYILQEKDFPGHLSEIEVAAGGVGYDNTDLVVITADVVSGNQGSGANASITTYANGSILSVNIDKIGNDYINPPTISITAANGSPSNGTGANLIAYNGGYISIPENIIGAINIFDVSSSIWGGAANMFNIQYQIALNDMYTLSSVSMVPYVTARMQIAEIAQWFVGKQPIRYNRHKNKMYLDMDWHRVGLASLLVIEAYEIVNPDSYKDAWSDRWLLQYCTALIKKQWGNNLKKYDGMKMSGGLVFNGQKIFDEAQIEIKELEQRMVADYSLPVTDMIG